MSTLYRPCPQCGMPQIPTQVFCSNCGAHLTDGSSSFNAAPAEFAPSLPPGATDERQLPFPSAPVYRQPPLAYDNTQFGRVGYGGQNYAPPPPNVGYPFPNPYEATQNGGIYVQQQNNVYPRSRRSRKKSNFLFPLLGILVLIILAGGGFFAYMIKNSGKASTASTIIKNQSTSSTVLSKQPPLFTDNFGSNNKNWDLRSSSGYGATIGNNELTMKEANHRIFQEPIPATVPNDFMVMATFTLVQGDSNDSVGLQLRTGSNNSQGYVVEVYGDDTFDIVKVAPDPNDTNKLQFTTLSAPTSSSAIRTKGMPNTMVVTMKGSSLVIQFNGTVVKSLTDASFNSGSINLFLVNGDTSTGAIATFTSFAIYPASAQLSR